MKADKIILELFQSHKGVYIYATNLRGTVLVGCIAHPPTVDPLLNYVHELVEKHEPLLKDYRQNADYVPGKLTYGAESADN